MSSEASDNGSFHKIGCYYSKKKPKMKSISDLETSVFLNISDNASCKNTPHGNDQGVGGRSEMYVNNLEDQVDQPGSPEPGLGHVNHLEYIDASCFSSPNLAHSFLASCDDNLLSISSLFQELNSPEISQFEKEEGKGKLNGCKLSPSPMEGEVLGGRDDEVSISSVLSNASPHQRKESKEAKKSSDEDARTLKTDGPGDISTGGGVKLKEKGPESALEDKKIATIENLNKWGFLR